jgi:hypothetical protein
MFVIVIARYNEDIDWSKQFQNVIVYNKGKELPEAFTSIPLNNVGREGHTYYKYICDNYDNLQDYTIFLQGNPFDHSPSIIKKLHEILNHTNFLRTDFTFLSEFIHHSTFDKECNKYWQCKNIHNTYQRVFSTSCDGKKECIFGAGAQFIVSKNKIRQRPKSFYENIVHILESSVDPLEGYDIERFHKYIFT